jgi:hypothetical protein
MNTFISKIYSSYDHIRHPKLVHDNCRFCGTWKSNMVIDTNRQRHQFPIGNDLIVSGRKTIKRCILFGKDDDDNLNKFRTMLLSNFHVRDVQRYDEIGLSRCQHLFRKGDSKSSQRMLFVYFSVKYTRLVRVFIHNVIARGSRKDMLYFIVDTNCHFRLHRRCVETFRSYDNIIIKNKVTRCTKSPPQSSVIFLCGHDYVSRLVDIISKYEYRISLRHLILNLPACTLQTAHIEIQHFFFGISTISF